MTLYYSKKMTIMEKLLIFCAAMLVFGLMACKNGNVNSLEADTTPQSDTISYDSDTLKEVKQYDSEGRRTGSWTYEEYGSITGHISRSILTMERLSDSRALAITGTMARYLQRVIGVSAAGKFTIPKAKR